METTRLIWMPCRKTARCSNEREQALFLTCSFGYRDGISHFDTEQVRKRGLPPLMIGRKLMASVAYKFESGLQQSEGEIVTSLQCGSHDFALAAPGMEEEILSALAVPTL